MQSKSPKIRIDYGEKGIEVSLNPNWNVDIIQPSSQEVLEDPIGSITTFIRNPIGTNSLQDIVANKKEINQACIVTSDATRPVPSHFILEALVDELERYQIKDNKIIVLIATGLHRPSNEDEIKRILGKKLFGRIKTMDHIATDMNSLDYLGKTTDGTPMYLNKLYLESDLKILTGYVEPHFFFGFSGGRKSIVPGIAGEKTIQANHSAEMIDSKYSRFGFYDENLLHQNSIEIGKKVYPDFTINVCINEQHLITKVSAGDLESTHQELVNYQLEKVFQPINTLYDIVVCGNGGYPLDLNLYQAVKSMAIGELSVKQGGTIISVNECRDGIGIGQDKFKELLFSKSSPEELYSKIITKKIIVPDQWEIQVLARILQKAEVYLISELDKRGIGNIGLKYASTIEEAIEYALNKHGSDAKILILPNGPQILPLLQA
jgi:nickel-dependent lactate racemase